MAKSEEKIYLLRVPEVREAFLSTIKQISFKASLSGLEQAIADGNIELAYKMSGMSAAVFNELLDKVEEVYNESGENFVSKWPNKITTATSVVFPMFNIRNTSVQKQLQDYSADFVKEIEYETKESIRLVLQYGQELGENPKTTALNIIGRIDPTTKTRVGGVIGLSSNQTKWVINVRKYLKTGDPRYFLLGLRDKRFDEFIKKNQPLTDEKITQITTAYEKKALKYRGDAIARTEVISAINRAEEGAIVQAIDEGTITAKQVRKWWDDTGDSRERSTHVWMGKKYSQDKAIPYDQPFEFPDGQKAMYPMDTSLGLGAKEIVNCRCKVQYDIDFLAEATGEYKNV